MSLTTILAPSGTLALVLVLASCASATWAAQGAQQAKSLIGTEYVARQGDNSIAGSDCLIEGGEVIEIGGQLRWDWGIGFFACGGRTVYALERHLGYDGRDPKARIVDSLTFPPAKKGVEIFIQGECEVDGKIGTTMFALVRLGRRDRVDHRTGVLAAWTVDLQAGKIVPLATERVVCYRPTPP